MTTSLAEPHLTRSDVPRALLCPATLNGLLRMALEEWAAIAVCWIAFALAPGTVRPWIYPVLGLIVAGRYHALGVLLHDAAHLPQRRRSVAAFSVEVLCGYPVASTIEAMRYHHLRHHRDSGMETDPYFKVGSQTTLWWMLNVARGALLVPFWTVRAVVGAMSLVVPRLRNTYGHVFLQDRTSTDLSRSAELNTCARAEIGQLACQTAIVAALVHWPLPVTLGYVIPVTIAGVLSARRLLLEHTYERTTDRRIETIIATTRDNHVDWLGRLLLAPRNVGCHIVHHIHPQVGLTHLPELRDWYREHHAALYPSPHTGVQAERQSARLTSTKLS